MQESPSPAQFLLVDSLVVPFIAKRTKENRRLNTEVYTNDLNDAVLQKEGVFSSNT